MVATNYMTIKHSPSTFSYKDACELAGLIARGGEPRMVVVDLERTSQTTTAALARLIVLRRNLMETGRDLRVLGLRGRASGLYEINRMGNLLPRPEFITPE